MLHRGAEKIVDLLVDVAVAGHVGTVADMHLAGVAGGGEEVVVGEADVAAVVAERHVPAAVADRGRVPSRGGGAVVAVGGGDVAAAEDERPDGVRRGAEGAGGEVGGRGGGVLAEGAEEEAQEVGLVRAACRVVAEVLAAERPRLCCGGERVYEEYREEEEHESVKHGGREEDEAATFPSLL